jgi:uncharacterized protein
MPFTWDECKRQANLLKHGLDFADVEEGFDFENAVIEPARRRRYKAIGRLRGDAVGLIFAPLGTEGVSLISLRPASKYERKRLPKR